MVSVTVTVEVTVSATVTVTVNVTGGVTVTVTVTPPHAALLFEISQIQIYLEKPETVKNSE